MILDGATVRRVILEVVGEYSEQYTFEIGSALQEIGKRLEMEDSNTRQQQLILDFWYDQFRTGVLAWGHEIGSPGWPYCHITDRGREALKHLSRDPANPDGYKAYLDERAALDSIAKSYIFEGLDTYNANCFKATAVMVGAAAERLVLNLRDTLTTQLTASGRVLPKGLNDKWTKTIRDALTKELDSHKKDMPTKLEESYSSNWQTFGQQIRRARNEAGHPAAIEPVTPEDVHAALLVFPELAKLVSELEQWIREFYI